MVIPINVILTIEKEVNTIKSKRYMKQNKIIGVPYKEKSDMFNREIARDTI